MNNQNSTAENYDIVLIRPNSFQLNKHYYPAVLLSSLSSKAEQFLSLDNQTIAHRYSQKYGEVNTEELSKLLKSSPLFFGWSGGDLFHVHDRREKDMQEKMLLIEMNTCPSGQKSMPNRHQNGYHDMMRRMFKPLIMSWKTKGALAVIFDQSPMEARGFAEALADVMNENVFYVKFENKEKLSIDVKFIDRQLAVKDATGEWHLIRAAFRYVTQKPWNRIPLNTKTLIVNPIVACLAGGRNKMLASHAYQLFNEKYAKHGIQIRVPETIINVHREDIPSCIKKLGGMGVIKVPYLNSGQGIFTVVNDKELNKFMTMVPVSSYHSYIVQSLIGHHSWDTNDSRRYTHVLTSSEEKNDGYVKDLRVQICSSPDGFKATSIYCRRARQPLSSDINMIDHSWEMLGTNLCVKKGSEASSEWTTESDRLIIMSDNDTSGLSIDNLIDGYVQTVLGTLAIDQLAQQLMDEDGNFNMILFKSLNDDDDLISEILL